VTSQHDADSVNNAYQWKSPFWRLAIYSYVYKVPKVKTGILCSIGDRCVNMGHRKRFVAERAEERRSLKEGNK